MGEISRVNASVLEDASLVWLEEPILVEPCLEEAPFEELCGDIVMGSAAPALDLLIELLNLTPTSFPLLPTTPSYVCAYHESLGDVRGYNPSLDPCCAYLEDVLRKIMWSTFFDHAFDFSMVFGKFKKPLTFLASSFVVLSYLNYSELHATTYDKILRALIAS